MHNSSFVYCAAGTGTWTDPPHPRRHRFVVPILAILTALAAGGLALWYYLNSWISLPLL